MTTIAWFGLALLAGCKTDLYASITQREANEIVAALASKNIDAVKDSPDGKTWTVRVEEAELPRAIDTLGEFGLPKQVHENMGSLFRKSGMVSSRVEERIRFIYGVSEELANTLSQIDGIVTARVHVVIPDNELHSATVQPSSASVFIKYRPGVDIVAITPSIKNLVQRSIQGLSFESISVSAFPSQLEPAPAPARNGLDTGGGAMLALGAIVALATASAATLLWRAMRRTDTSRATVPSSDGEPATQAPAPPSAFFRSSASSPAFFATPRRWLSRLGVLKPTEPTRDSSWR